MDVPAVRELIAAINQMDISEEVFKLIRILIRYFRFPILIILQKFYERLQREKNLMLLIDNIQIMEDREYSSLKFYLKVDSFHEDNHPVNEPKEFKDFIFKINGRLRVIVEDKSKYLIDQA
jgi:hypothetical protein